MSNKKSVLHKIVEDCLEVVSSTPQSTKSKTISKFFSQSNIYMTLEEFTVVDEKKLDDYTNTLNDKYTCPYTFFEITEILNFTKFYHPYNSNLKTVGIYTSNNRYHFLKDYRFHFLKSKNLCIMLDFTSINVLPSFGDAIEVYGFILYLEQVFVVQYWTNTNLKYIQRNLFNLLNQKCYTPYPYKQIKCNQQEQFIS